MRIVIQIFCC